MLRITFVRHGQTNCSCTNSFCGAVDVPLNDAGHAMAVAIADSYAGTRWAAIYTSPLQRARDTASPLAERVGLPLQIERGLREISYGAWDGMLEADVERMYSAEFKAWSEDPAAVAPPGGETAVEIQQRALAVIDAIRERYPDGEVFVASHKATIRIVVCSLLGINVRDFRRRVGQEVGASTVFEFKSTGPLLAALNDFSHLPPELRHLGGT
jgi:probable phosphoglycerate mutase